MHQNAKFHQEAQSTFQEINDEVLENVTGGASANASGIQCRYCGRDDSFVWARFANGDGTSYRYCTACKHIYNNI